MNKPKFKGISVELGDTTYILPPLALGDLEMYQDKFSDYDGSLSPKSTKLIIDLTHAALLRNYPDMMRAEVAGLMDLGTMNECFEAIMDVSGVKRKSVEAGNVKA